MGRPWAAAATSTNYATTTAKKTIIQIHGQSNYMKRVKELRVALNCATSSAALLEILYQTSSGTPGSTSTMYNLMRSYDVSAVPGGDAWFFHSAEPTEDSPAHVLHAEYVRADGGILVWPPPGQPIFLGEDDYVAVRFNGIPNNATAVAASATGD